MPLLSGKLTSERIWAAKVMVEHSSDLTYINIMRSTNQEDTLEWKASFEIWTATFGGKINRYHAYNGRFSEQPFISEIEDSNQTITFCGVVSHHQMPFLKGKFKL